MNSTTARTESFPLRDAGESLQECSLRGNLDIDAASLEATRTYRYVLETLACTFESYLPGVCVPRYDLTD